MTQDYFDHFPHLAQFRHKTSFTLPVVSLDAPDPVYERQLNQLKKGTVWLGFVGRLAREKGLASVLAALDLLPLSNQYCLVFAGPSPQTVVGESAYAQALINRLKSHPYPFRFLGQLSPSALTAFYRSLDILLLPSVNSTEAFGIVQAEAMLANTPVIAGQLPGVRIPVQMTGMGLLVPPHDPQALAQAITQILSNRDHYLHQAKAQQLFDPQITYTHYDQIINQLT